MEMRGLTSTPPFTARSRVAQIDLVCVRVWSLPAAGRPAASPQAGAYNKDLRSVEPVGGEPRRSAGSGDGSRGD